MLVTKIFFVSLFIILLCLPVSAGEELKTDVNRSIENNQRLLEQNQAPEADQLIIQQQEMLKTIDEVDVFKSLEDARKVLKDVNKQQKYIK